jgi:UDP-N-acetylmuramoyl-L-alanyl-D-glutamate--2,6-diaminopimelate ligase
VTVRAESLRERLTTAGLLVQWPANAPDTFSSVTTDSRTIEPGALFAAYAGTSFDAHVFVPTAASAGATAVLCERAVEGTQVPQILVTDGRRAAAVAAALAAGDPASRLTLVAVTGTNGKTTSVHLLRHLLGDDTPAASIGTLGAILGDGTPVPGSEGLTTPGPVELQRVLATLVAGGVRTVAMEASSHSLDQDRLWGLSFRAGVFTNLTRDHLDYHQSEERYFQAKARLVGLVPPDGWVVTNADAPVWQGLPAHPQRLTFGLHGPADVGAADLRGDAHGMRFTLRYRGAQALVALPLLGSFNVENALGAAAAALALGRPLDAVAARLATVPQVPGRMELLASEPCVVLRDYAHTPDGMTRALAALRPLTRGRLILVFGCGGDRDRGKRPVMGGIAARDADLVIITADNPRTETLESILDDIEGGMGEVPHLRILDRRVAIARAVSIARPGDTVLLAGKGHETYQIFGHEKHPFDEREIVVDAARALTR